MRVVRLIDRGGFGRVEEVELPAGKRRARKVFEPSPPIAHDPDLAKKAKKRFRREVEVQSKIVHPHVMPILEHDLDANPPWILMPLADRSFEEEARECKAAGTIPIDALSQVLSGLEEIHRLGYVHRDLKPRNVLYVENRWVIADFGLVLPPPSGTTTSITSSNSAWGTQAYAAPELVTDFRTAQAQADVYSVGCMIHDVVGTSPRVPFGTASAPGPLGSIIEKCTANRPQDRFPSVSSLRNALVYATAGPIATATQPRVQAWVDRLRATPLSLTDEDWQQIAILVEQGFGQEDAIALLESLDLEQLSAVEAAGPAAFPRLAVSICRWVREGGFEFAYCDVLGARLALIHSLGQTREKAEAAMAALYLGTSHNRWSVMRHFTKMAGPGISDDLADRLAIELLAMGRRALRAIEKVESEIHASREGLHPKLNRALEQIRGSLKV